MIISVELTEEERMALIFELPKIIANLPPLWKTNTRAEEKVLEAKYNGLEKIRDALSDKKEKNK